MPDHTGILSANAYTLEGRISELERHISADHGVDLDWVTIIDTLLPVLIGCFENEQKFLNAVKRINRMQRASLRLTGRRNGMSRFEAKVFCNCCCECCARWEDELLTQCYRGAAELIAFENDH